MIRAHSRSRLKNPGAFPPGLLFAGGQQGVWLDPSDMSTLFQDDAGTVPVTADGQAVGRISDKSGNNHHAVQATAANRPIFRTSGGLSWLEFDGINDFLVTDAVNLASTDKITLFGGVRKLLDTPTGIFIESSANGGTTDGTFAITAPTSAVPGSYGFNLRGTLSISRAASVFTAPITNVVSCSLNIAGADFNTEILPRANGLVPTLSGGSNAGTGNFTSQLFYIGMRGGVSLPFSGNLYGLLVRGSASDGTEIALTESYMAAKSGITI